MKRLDVTDESESEKCIIFFPFSEYTTAFYLEREKEGQAGNMKLPAEAQINETFTQQVTYARVKLQPGGHIFISSLQLKLKPVQLGGQAIKISTISLFM